MPKFGWEYRLLYLCARKNKLFSIIILWEAFWKNQILAWQKPSTALSGLKETDWVGPLVIKSFADLYMKSLVQAKS